MSNELPKILKPDESGVQRITVQPEDSDEIVGNVALYEARLGKVESLIQAVLWVGVITLVGVVVAVVGLFIEQSHFNLQMYSNRSEVQETQMKELNLKVKVLEKKLHNNYQQLLKEKKSQSEQE